MGYRKGRILLWIGLLVSCGCGNDPGSRPEGPSEAIQKEIEALRECMPAVANPASAHVRASTLNSRDVDHFAECAPVKQLVARGASVCGALAHALRDSDPRMRAGAMAVMSRLGPVCSGALEDVLHLLNDENTAVTREAAKAALAIGGASGVRAEFARAVSGRYGWQAQRAVLRALSANPSAASEYLAEVVVLMERLRNRIVNTLSDDFAVGLDAALLLKSVGPRAESVAPVLRHLYAVTRAAAFGAALAAVSEESFSELIGAELRSRDLARIDAALACMDWGTVVPRRLIPEVLTVVSDPDPAIRKSAIIAIGRMPIDEVGRARIMARLINDRDGSVRARALHESAYNEFRRSAVRRRLVAELEAIGALMPEAAELLQALKQQPR